MTGLYVSEKQLQKEKTDGSFMGMFFCVMFSAGAFGILLSGFSKPVRLWIICMLTGVVIAGMTILLARSRWKAWSFPFVTLLTVAVIVFELSRIKNGMAILLNQWLMFLTGKTGKIYLDFSVDGTKGMYLFPVLVTGYLSALLMLQTVQKRISVATGIFLICIAGCTIGFLQADTAVPLMTVAYCGMILEQKTESADKKKSVLGVVVWIAAIVCLAGGGGYLLHQKVSFDMAKSALEAKIHEERYDHGQSVLSDGNLKNLGRFPKNSKTALEIQMEEPQKTYLRGMTGDVYTGNAWKSLDETAYQQGKDLFYWLHKSDFYAQCGISQASALGNEKENSSGMEIKNVSACSKYQYLPYGLADSATLAADRIGDDQNLSNGKKQTITYDSGSVPEWYQTAVWLSEHQDDKKVTAYLAKEESYRKYVYQYDLQLTDTATGVCEQLFSEEDKETRYSLTEALELVQKILNDNLEYKEDVVTYNGSNDFFKYVMEQSKGGYSVQYATAATLMLRYLGVPARYVEGYYLSSKEAEKYQSEEKISITKAQAHAWTEYYLDGVGWIPFEVTPGYIDEEENKQISEILSGGQEDGEGQTFRQSTQTYVPPQHQQEKETVPDQIPHFQMRVRYFLSGVVSILILCLIILAIWSMKRRKKLLKFFASVENSDRRTAIVELYGYSQMLIQRCEIQIEENTGEIEEINTEARFSNHEMKEEQKQKMTEYVKEVVCRAKAKKGFWKKLKHHYLLWLYY